MVTLIGASSPTATAWLPRGCSITKARSLVRPAAWSVSLTARSGICAKSSTVPASARVSMAVILQRSQK